MKIDENLFRSILFETIDENPLASRAVLSLCSVEFTNTVPTLCVSLGKQSILSVNLEFVQTHCQTVEHVKTLLIHEFLHILLGHTLRLKTITPALNIALDAVINAIIHRKFGASYSSFLSQYYGEKQDILSLLRPLNYSESSLLSATRTANAPCPPLLALHSSLYAGTTLAEDVLSIAQSLSEAAIKQALEDGTLLIGGHGDTLPDLDSLGHEGAKRFEQSITDIGSGIFHDQNATKPTALIQAPKQKILPTAWRRETLPVLKRLLIPDPKSAILKEVHTTHFAPILNTADRRGALRALWSPLIPEIAWHSTHQTPLGSVQIYLDVSGSMNWFLDALVLLLAEFSRHIRKPLWAFSTKVYPARIINGKLDTNTTGGTSLACVFEHIKKTNPEKALIVTDGFFDYCSKKPSCEIEAIIPYDGCSKVLKKSRIRTTRLPQLKTK